AQQQNATNLQQVTDQLKQSPVVNALKAQIDQLEREMKERGNQNAQTEAANQALLKQMRDQLTQANKALAQRQQAPSVQPVQPDAQAPSGSSPSFEALYAQANDQYQHGHAREALALITQAIGKDEKRWEGWDLGGTIAFALQDYPGAAEMLEKALLLAPA